MTKHITKIITRANHKLWEEYVAVDFGRAEPDREKKYTGFKQFVAYKTGAYVTRQSIDNYTLEFETGEELVMYKMKYE